MIRVAGTLIIAAVLVGCQGVPADFKPDPSLQTASVPALKSKIASSCVISQRARSSASTGELQRKCGCYAGKLWTDMSDAEVTFYRTNGYFGDSVRPKGESAIAACKLTPV